MFKIDIIDEYQHNQNSSVPVSELFSDHFVVQYTNFPTIRSMFMASGFRIESREDFARIPDAEWDRFIRSNSKFDSWQSMLTAAGKAWAAKRQPVPRAENVAKAKPTPTNTIHLTDQDLQQLTHDALLKLDEEALRHLAGRLLYNLKEARERLNKESKSASSAAETSSSKPFSSAWSKAWGNTAVNVEVAKPTDTSVAVIPPK